MGDEADEGLPVFCYMRDCVVLRSRRQLLQAREIV
jgi:hypothetical protein